MSLPILRTQDTLVSVVMPCYNVADTLEEAVNSVLAQTHQNFELILIDDGSTDGATPELCDSFARDKRVRVIHQENTGLAGARNAGMREAVGEYIALLDSDDLFEPEKLEAHVAHFQLQPELGLSFSYSRFISDEGKKLPMIQGGRVTEIEPAHVLCRNPIGNGSAAVLRRTALYDVAPPGAQSGEDQQGNFFDRELRQSEDVEFWLRLITTTRWKIGGISQPLTRYRLSNGGLSANTGEQLATWEAFLRKASSYAPELVGEFGGRARAYQLRYLCRRSIQLRRPSQAVGYLVAAFREDLAILWQEPARTLGTAAACLLAYCVVPLWRVLPGRR